MLKKKERRKKKREKKNSKKYPNIYENIIYNKPPITTIKIPLKNIIKDSSQTNNIEVYNIIQEKVNDINIVTTHTYHFLKLMILYYL